MCYVSLRSVVYVYIIPLTAEISNKSLATLTFVKFYGIIQVVFFLTHYLPLCVPVTCMCVRSGIAPLLSIAGRFYFLTNWEQVI